MRYPDFLSDGGSIGFIAPAFGCSIEPYKSAFNAAQKKFSDMGYRCVLGPNCYASEGVGISNTPEKCGKELNSFYMEQESDILISCGGGELMCEVVPFIDFDAISKAKPKWYMGYSDNTNFTFLSATLADTAAIYGPCAAAFGMKPWHRSLNDAMNILTGSSVKDGRIKLEGYDKWEMFSVKDEENPYVPYNVTMPSRIISLHEGKITEYDENRPLTTGDLKMSGRLIGGCLDCLVNLVGTKYDKVKEFSDRYSEDGLIWFLECCDLGPLDLRRAMWQLRQAGWFDKAAGFIIGRSLRYGEEMMGVDMYSAVVDITSDLDKPILMDADVGHHPPMLPLICGSYATVTTMGNSYKVMMELR